MKSSQDANLSASLSLSQDRFGALQSLPRLSAAVKKGPEIVLFRMLEREKKNLKSCRIKYSDEELSSIHHRGLEKVDHPTELTSIPATPPALP